MNDVYITLRNSSVSGWFLHKIEDHFASCGISYFIDREHRRRGTFPDTLVREIENTQNFLIIATPDTWGRDDDKNSWMTAEISTAIRLNKNIITIVSSDFIWPRNIPERISEIRNKTVIVFDDNVLTESLNIISASLQLNISNTISNIIAPYSGNEPYIFISYSHQNNAQVFPIIKQLIKDGYRVWYDEDIRPGEVWRKKIFNRIENCHYFISFVTHTYINSPYCEDEIRKAQDLDKKRFLIYLEEVELTDAIEQLTGSIQNIYKYRYSNEQVFYNKLYQADGLDLCKGNTATTTPGNDVSNHVWYACYGANVNTNHFMNYLKRCSNRYPPLEEREFTIPYTLCFGGTSRTWNGYGTAFLNYNKIGQTRGKLYRITKQQFQEIKRMEGSKYSKTLGLGTLDSVPVYTFSCEEFLPRNIPSAEYLYTIRDGLKDLYRCVDDNSLAIYFRNAIFTPTEYAVIKTIRTAPHGLAAIQISRFTDLPVDDINTAIKFLQKIRILKRDSRTGEGPDAVYYTVKKHRDLLDFLIM